MTEPNWTISESDKAALLKTDEQKANPLKFLIFGLLLLGAVGFLVFQALSTEGQFFITIQEYFEEPERYAENDFRIGAWVDGETIQFTQVDDFNSVLEFDIVDDMAAPTQRLSVIAYNQPKPDLLTNEAQALVEGSIDADGNLVANPDGVLLKCPTKSENGEAYTFEESY